LLHQYPILTHQCLVPSNFYKYILSEIFQAESKNFKRGILNILFKPKTDTKTEQFAQLIQIMRDDAEINQRIIQLLKLDSYQRRVVLNRWLEQLRRIDASEKLTQALSCLFDDDISNKTLSLLKK